MTKLRTLKMSFENLSKDMQLAVKHAIAVAWTDENFAEKLRENPHEAISELGYLVPTDMNIIFE